MKEAEFLIARPASRAPTQPFLIGETGFSFSDVGRSTSILDAWMNDEGIPAVAKSVFAKNSHFADMVGLVGVPTRSQGRRGPTSGWVLARASSGLVSVAICDAQDCDSRRLQEDADFAISEAKRFAANLVVVLVQAASRKDAEVGRKSLETAFKTSVPELDQLYASGQSSPSVWLASLSNNT